MGTVENLSEYLAAIVENSDDAIITKNLQSIIQTWNGGAERLFGYTAEEAVGQPIMMLIPRDRQHEEADIIARLHRGERIEHFETFRRRKNGSLVPISLTISPVRNASGEVIGASKVARDITQQRAAAERQNLLLADELATLMRERLVALSDAHRLAVVDPTGDSTDSTSLLDLIKSVIEPFAGDQFCELDVEDLRIASSVLTPMALVFYELCTNAAKYGALCQRDGGLTVTARRQGDRFLIDWQERCSIDPQAVSGAGFGTQMCDSVVKSALGGTISRRFRASGATATIDLDLATLEDR